MDFKLSNDPLAMPVSTHKVVIDLHKYGPHYHEPTKCMKVCTRLCGRWATSVLTEEMLEAYRCNRALARTEMIIVGGRAIVLCAGLDPTT